MFSRRNLGGINFMHTEDKHIIVITRGTRESCHKMTSTLEDVQRAHTTELGCRSHRTSRRLEDPGLNWVTDLHKKGHLRTDLIRGVSGDLEAARSKGVLGFDGIKIHRLFDKLCVFVSPVRCKAHKQLKDPQNNFEVLQRRTENELWCILIPTCYSRFFTWSSHQNQELSVTKC